MNGPKELFMRVCCLLQVEYALFFQSLNDIRNFLIIFLYLVYLYLRCCAPYAHAHHAPTSTYTGGKGCNARPEGDSKVSCRIRLLAYLTLEVKFFF
jgi:hypothetical protein